MTFLRVLVRRWDVVVPGFLLTVVTVIAAGASVAPEYEAEGSVLLLGPSTSASSQGTVPVNPYLNIPSSLESTAVIIAESLRSERTIGELADLGATVDYELTPTEKTPILTVAARGLNKDQVLHTAEVVLQRVQEDLATRQQEAGVPSASLIRSQVLSPPRATMHAGSKPRVMAAVGALGLGLTVTLAFGVESFAAWRTRGRQADTAPTSVGPALADIPLVSSEPAPHPDPASVAAHGNGWQPHAPSVPLIDAAVDRAEPAPAEDHLERVTVAEALANNEASGNEVSASGAPAENGKLEQQDGLVEAWWSAWERRQSGRRAAQDPRVEPSDGGGFADRPGT